MNPLILRMHGMVMKKSAVIKLISFFRSGRKGLRTQLIEHWLRFTGKILFRILAVVFRMRTEGDAKVFNRRQLHQKPLSDQTDMEVSIRKERFLDCKPDSRYGKSGD